MLRLFSLDMKRNEYKKILSSLLLIIICINIFGSYYSISFIPKNVLQQQPAFDELLDEFIISASIIRAPEKPGKVINHIEIISTINSNLFTKHEVFLTIVSKSFSFVTRFKTFLAVQFSTDT